ncbi:MAG TPA: hypothetical protein VK658_07060 [Chryseolinea sp.]|nr:hypothetical protein [Chryseolinea sp.]
MDEYLRCLSTVSLTALCILLLTMIDTAPLDLTFQDSSSFVSPGIILLLMYGLDFRKATRTASSFKLTVSDETITREVDRATTRAIPVREVRFIRKWANGSYVIRGNDMMKPIIVPFGIERADELERLLSTLTRVTIQPLNLNLYKLFLLLAVLAFTLIGSLFAGNKYMGQY